MKKKFLSFLSIFLIAAFLTSPVAAGPGIKLSGVTFSLGSLVATGYVSGLGNSDVKMVLEGSGPAVILCTNGGQNAVPGQSYPKVSATGDQLLDGDQNRTKNGRTAFQTTASTSEPLPWDVAGCPNANWVGEIDFVFWENATIYIYDLAGNQLLRQDFTCVTTRDPNSITCTAVN
jgi:hypothetical protein